MRDVIEAHAHRLLQRHGPRDMARHGHAQCVRPVDQRPDDVGLELRVELDLLEAGVLVCIDHRNGLLRCVRPRRAEGTRSAAVDEPRQQKLRAGGRTLAQGIPERDEERRLAAHVASGRHAGRQHGRRELDLRGVQVHVPQAGHDGAALDVE